MPCRNHPMADAGLTDCWICGQTFCPECLAEFQGRMMCAPCKAEAVARLEQGASAHPGGGPESGAPRPLAADAAIGFGWRTMSKTPSVIVTIFLANLVAGLLPQIGNVIRIVGTANRDRDLEMTGVVVYVILAIVNLPVTAWITCGTWKYLLKLARGQNAELSDVFSGGPVLAMLGAMFVFGICAFLGFLLCIVPGVIFVLGCQFYAPLLVDRGCGVVESLQKSWELTKGYKGSLFALMLLSFCVAIAGFLACCVGILVAVPIIQLASAYAYLTVTGQRTAESA